MRLTDLAPHWVLGSEFHTPDGVQHYICANCTHDRHGMGMSFLCPVHRSHRLAIFFANPVDGRPPQVCSHLWQRQGDSFEVMTISPSIDASEYPGCWHGHIENGEIV